MGRVTATGSQVGDQIQFAMSLSWTPLVSDNWEIRLNAVATLLYEDDYYYYDYYDDYEDSSSDSWVETESSGYSPTASLSVTGDGGGSEPPVTSGGAEFIGYAYRGKWDGTNMIICGTVMQGSGSTPIVARVLGPSLAPYSSANLLTNPRFKQRIAGQDWSPYNVRWGDQDNNGSIDSTASRDAFLDRVAQTGMVDFISSTSYDAAMAFDTGPVTRLFWIEADDMVQPGEFLWEWSNADPSTGVDAVNLSVRRKFINGNRDRMSFTIAEGPSQQVIITARGPSLSGLIGSLPFLTDPVIALYDGDQQIAYNDNWNSQTDSGVTGQAIVDAVTAASLSPFASTASKDSAILATLSPGSYEISLWGGLMGPQTDGEVVLSVTLIP